MNSQAGTVLSNTGASATNAQINLQPPNSNGSQAPGTLPAGAPTQGSGVDLSANLSGGLLLKIGIGVAALIVVVVVVRAIRR